MDVCTATSRGHAKRRVSKKNRSWHRRLHLRKAVVQPPAMQGQDKHGPKKIAKKWERSSVWPPSKETPQEARSTSDGGSTLRFPCSQCGGQAEYAPKDLARHFVEQHGGSRPVFSCQMCTFSAHEFSYLQVHLLSHKDTLSSCSMCNDNVQRTWPEFSAHLTMYHCSDGKFSCDTCKKFSTSDFPVFLEHVCKHNLNIEEVDGGSALHRRDKNQLPATPTPCCQFCGFEASENRPINKHAKAAHVCQNGSQRKDGRRVHSIAMKPADPIPRVQTRLTRSTVRDTCWLTKDCLSLPGKEFLDKYCHLSDPQTTLEETQQFLMQSVAGETDDQKWTKALKSVLSGVPQKNPENGVTQNVPDLAVLTVKNKITVAPIGAAHAKRFKMTPTDKEAAGPDSAGGDTLCASEQIGLDLNSKNQLPRLIDNKPRDDFWSSGTGTPKNQENHKLKADLETQENSRKLEEPKDAEGICKSSNLKLTNERKEKTPAGRKGKIQKRRKIKSRFKKLKRRSEGEALKIVIKKNQVRGNQWVSLSPKQELEMAIGHMELSNPHLADRVDQNFITGSPGDSKQTLAREPIKPTGAEDVTAENDLPAGVPSTHQEMHDDEEGSGNLSDKSGETDPAAASGTDVGRPPEHPMLQTSHLSADCQEPEEKRSSSAATQPGGLNLDDSRLEHPAEQPDQVVEGLRNKELQADSSPRLLQRLLSPQQKSSRAAAPQWQLVPKHQQRTLKLVAINPSQPVKRPAGDQPVVVLNHPDADIPQVARIMQVVNKYRQVRKVLLSRRTLRALSALSGEEPETDDPSGDQGENSVQERFTLRLKFRRLSRKKYEIVGVASPGQEAQSRFPCWFCGRVFTSQEGMMVHRQRHLMDWRKPNCEKS